MGYVDIIFAIVLLLAILRGYSKGLLGTLAGYAAPVIAFVVARGWSEPVHTRLVEMYPDAAILIDFLAPVLVFLVVVIVIRILAALLGRVLGVGRSTPGRVLAAAVSVTVSALVLGAFVVLVDRIKPRNVSVDDSERTNEDALEVFILDVDRQLNESILAPPMARMARAVIDKAMEHQDQLPMLSRDEIEGAAQKAANAAAGVMVPGAKGSLGEAVAQDIPQDGAPAKDGAPKDAPAADAPAKDRVPKDAAPKDAVPTDAPAKDAVRKDQPAKDAVPKDAPAKDRPPLGAAPTKEGA